MIVLDANVIIAYWGTDDPPADAAFEIIDTEEDLILHPVTLAETLVWPARQGHEEVALADIARLGVDRHDPPLDEPVRVARLRSESGLKLPDAYVLATAIQHSAVLATFDRRLAEAARARGITVLGA